MKNINKLIVMITIFVCALGIRTTIELADKAAYVTYLERHLQEAESERAFYRNEWLLEREKNYIEYDRQRQIDANREGQEAIDGDTDR